MSFRGEIAPLQVITIILSFAAFTKPFSIHYLAPGALVTVGIFLSSAAKQEHRNSTHERRLIALGLCIFPFMVIPYSEFLRF